LTSLIAKKSWEFNIQPSGSSFFNDKIYPNVIGHRDVDCTECPGEQLHATLPTIISSAQTKLDMYTSVMPRVYQSEIMMSPLSAIEMKKNEEKEIMVSMKNTGTTTWRNYGNDKTFIAVADIKNHIASIDGVRLAVDPTVGSTATSTPAIVQPSLNPAQFIAASLTMPNVVPGQVGTFKLKLKQQSDEYISKQKFVLAVGSKGWVPTGETSVDVVNTGLDYAGVLVKEKEVYDLLDDIQTSITLHFVNKGTKEWKKGEVLLKLAGNDGGDSELSDTTWKKKDGSFSFVEKAVKPGEAATFTFFVKTKKLGDLSHSLMLTQKDIRISGSDYEKIASHVVPAYAAEVITIKSPEKTNVLTRTDVSIMVKNTGALPWNKAELVMSEGVKIRNSAFYDSTWIGGLAVKKTGAVKPGDTAIFDFKIKSPKKSGQYQLNFILNQTKRTMYIQSAAGLEKSFSQPILIEDVKPKLVPKKPVKKK